MTTFWILLFVMSIFFISPAFAEPVDVEIDWTIEGQTKTIVNPSISEPINQNQDNDVNTFNEKIQKDLQGTVWQTGCASWYKRDDGKNFTIWPGTTYGYAWQTRTIKQKNFNWVTQTQQKQNFKQAS